MQNSIYKIKYLLFFSWDWEAWCLTQSGGGNTLPPERNTVWNKGRKCFHCLGAQNNLIRPCCKVRTDIRRSLENPPFIVQNSKSTFHVPSCSAQAVIVHSVLTLRLEPPKGRWIFVYSANPSSHKRMCGTSGPSVPERCLSLCNSSISVWIDVHDVDRLKIVVTSFTVTTNVNVHKAVFSVCHCH